MDPTTKKIVLIIEDDVHLRSALSEKLQIEGFDTLEAKNGKEGLDLAIKIKPEMILLDIVMPEMDGMATASKLRKDKWGQNANIIFLTNIDESEKIKQSLEYKAFEYIIKSDRTLEDIVSDIKLRIGSESPN